MKKKKKGKEKDLVFFLALCCLFPLFVSDFLSSFVHMAHGVDYGILPYCHNIVSENL